ncbi:MAG: putative site-specific integrase-resolvase [bacterium]|jgi:predicted site-specific integrase-resolvase
MTENTNQGQMIISVNFKEAQTILGISKGTMLKYEKESKIRFTRIGRKKQYLIKHLWEIQTKGLK